jgi:hypothetical protein
MTDREALKLALEFIERVNKDGWILADFEPQMYAAITAIKEALAQPEQKYELVTYGEVWSSDGETWSRDGKVMDLAQPEERNFCPRCGKRTADLTTIHTCTPPQENT